MIFLRLKNDFFKPWFEYSNTCVAEYSNPIFTTNPSPIQVTAVAEIAATSAFVELYLAIAEEIELSKCHGVAGRRSHDLPSMLWICPLTGRIIRTTSTWESVYLSK